MILCGYGAAFAKSTAKFVLHFKSVLILSPSLAPTSEPLFLFFKRTNYIRTLLSRHCIIKICQKMYGIDFVIYLGRRKEANSNARTTCSAIIKIYH